MGNKIALRPLGFQIKPLRSRQGVRGTEKSGIVGPTQWLA